MSNAEKINEITTGMMEFNSQIKSTLDSISENLDNILNKHYQVNHTSHVTMDASDEFEYWESVFAGDSDLSYIMIRGKLKTGNTLVYDVTKFSKMYINGEEYTGNYTFNGDPDSEELLSVILVQADSCLVADFVNFPLRDIEICVHIGAQSRLQPDITSLLESDDCLSLHVCGDWQWKTSNYCPIRKLEITGVLSMQVAYNCPSLQHLIIPNTVGIAKNSSNIKSLRHLDISNVKGNIDASAFESASLYGNLVINATELKARSFALCKGITSVVIGNNVTVIGMQVFCDCTNISDVIIGDSVTQVLVNAFQNCTGLHHVTFGSSVAITEIGSFAGCTGISGISVALGYHCPVTYIQQSLALDWRCFLDVLTNCAVSGESGRTASTMQFKVASAVRTALTNAYNDGDETALAIYELMASKSITITT